MKVLVADDDETIRALINKLFTKRGDTVRVASDGDAAIQWLGREKFDLLVLDLMMPRTDGIGVLSHIATMAGLVPQVIVMTAASPVLAATIPREHVSAVVTKPFDITALLQLADDAVKANTPVRPTTG